MGSSLESSRPIMAPSITAKRASHRFSTYSIAPSVANTVQTSLTSDSAQQEMSNIEEGIDKLSDKKLQQQRFVPSQEKAENLSKLALGAKLDRALGRRMNGQDAEMRVKKQTSSKVGSGKPLANVVGVMPVLEEKEKVAIVA